MGRIKSIDNNSFIVNHFVISIKVNNTMNHTRTTMLKNSHHAIVNHDETLMFGMHLLPSWIDGYLIEGIDGLTFLEFDDPSPKCFYISLSVPFPLEISPSADDSILRETMSFLKHSFRFYTDKYKDDYAFKRPRIEVNSVNQEVWLDIAMRLKEETNEQA